jgi:hypothetical protein
VVPSESSNDANKKLNSIGIARALLSGAVLSDLVIDDEWSSRIGVSFVVANWVVLGLSNTAWAVDKDVPWHTGPPSLMPLVASITIGHIPVYSAYYHPHPFCFAGCRTQSNESLESQTYYELQDGPHVLDDARADDRAPCEAVTSKCFPYDTNYINGNP